MKSFIILSVIAFAAIANVQCIDLLDKIEQTTRIVNGHNSTRGQFPHQALLLLSIGEGQVGTCGGVLISAHHILTAAHCAVGVRSFEIHLGALVTRDRNETGRIVRTTNTSIIHPYYVPAITLNDIAILTLDEPVEFSDTIRPIRLPEAGNWFHGINAIASGFGLQNTSAPTIAPILQWTNLTTIDNLQCYRTFGVLVARLSVLCAVGDERRSACNGDSGGPLITESGDLIGLVSFGSGEGCHHGHPVVFTRVTYFLDWILTNTGLGQ